MWKLYVLGFIFILINAFGSIDTTSRKIMGKTRIHRKPEALVEIVNKNGYLAEERFVTTEDGYILSLHRMYGGPRSPPAPNKSLILLIHGMIASSDVWVMRGPNKDLAYLLVDEGYDVWLINVRGNSYSRRNVKISPRRPEFWRFSWHENGIYDMPATIDYILDQTGLSKVTLVGHSMGTTVSYVLLSIRPEYNEKIDLVVSLAPVAIFTPQFRGPLSIGVRFGKEALNSLRRSGIYEILPHTDFFPKLASGLCGRQEIKEICRDILFYTSGSADREQFDDSLISWLLQHYPAGTSVDTVDHYRQNIINESFREFDFGLTGNYARYGSAIPPEYPLKKITAPVILYYGLNDAFVQPADVRALEEKLPNVIASKMIQYKMFNHFDFVISRESKRLLYDDVIDVIRKYKVGATRRYL